MSASFVFILVRSLNLFYDPIVVPGFCAWVYLRVCGCWFYGDLLCQLGDQLRLGWVFDGWCLFCVGACDRCGFFVCVCGGCGDCFVCGGVRCFLGVCVSVGVGPAVVRVGDDHDRVEHCC